MRLQAANCVGAGLFAKKRNSDTRDDFSFKVHYVKKPRVKILEQVFKASSYAEKGLKALGVRLEAREVESVEAESFQDVQF